MVFIQFNLLVLVYLVVDILVLQVELNKFNFLYIYFILSYKCFLWFIILVNYNNPVWNTYY